MELFPDSDLDETKTKRILIAELVNRGHKKKWVESAIHPKKSVQPSKKKKGFLYFWKGTRNRYTLKVGVAVFPQSNGRI